MLTKRVLIHNIQNMMSAGDPDGNARFLIRFRLVVSVADRKEYFLRKMHPKARASWIDKWAGRAPR